MWLVFGISGTLICAGSAMLWRYLSRRRRSHRAGHGLHTCLQLLGTLQAVPNEMISRELRKCLVLMLHRHIINLQATSPEHPHIDHLMKRLGQLNRLPSGMSTTTMRSKSDRQAALAGFEQLIEIIDQAVAHRDLDSKMAQLGRAAARFAYQQLAVDIARKAALDAEHVRAYPQALGLVYQAHGLTRQMPPQLGRSLADAIKQDIERLERMVGKPLAN
ncbi:MAG: hypothetical protein AAF513_00805 [Pseudomonadota bacterium]